MPCEQIWEDRGTVWRHSGRLDFDELMRMILARNMDCRFRYAEYLIHDMSNVTELGVYKGGPEAIATNNVELTGLTPNLKVAIVTNLEKLEALIEQTSQKMQQSSWQIRTFRDFDAAYAWATAK